nr:hypothetical protein [Pseudooceanicola batsensis]
MIRRDQQRHDAIAELQGLIDDGLNSGPPETFDMSDFIRSRTDGSR